MRLEPLPKYDVECAELMLLIVLRYIVSLLLEKSHLWLMGVSYLGNDALSVSNDLNIFSWEYSFSIDLITEPVDTSNLKNAMLSVTFKHKHFNYVTYILLKCPCLLYCHQFD